MDVVTMLGFVILAGVVVNNAILLVDVAIQGMQAGATPKAAMLASATTRLRPIAMTAVGAVIGLLPLVVSSGAGSELYRGLGAVMVGGLLTSTLFTLVLIPILFTLWFDFQAALARVAARAPELGRGLRAPAEPAAGEPVELPARDARSS
jgi:HAE1 family hydrophobic/amphiphilic exporter-1